MRLLRSKVTMIPLALASLVALVPMAVVSHAASGTASAACSAPLKQADADAAMIHLQTGAFHLVDTAFNSSPAGLDPNYIATLGYFVDQTRSSLMVHFSR
jgi:hypothetical protein